MALRLGFYLRLLRAEGLSGLQARFGVRRAHVRNLRSFRPTGAAELRGLGLPLLNLLPVSRSPLLGGVQVQLATRLAEEARLRPVGLLFPEAGSYRLEAQWQGQRWFHDCGPATAGAEALARALGRALELTGARAVHAENLASFGAHGLLDAEPALGALARLRAADPGALVVSLHDYAVFCPRPFQVERPGERFCAFSRDLERCRRCLSNVPVPARLESTRASAGALLAGASALVCPSPEMRARLLELIPGLVPERLRAIAPSSGTRPSADFPRWPPRHAAIVGATRLEKGAHVAAELVPLLRALGLSVSAHGGAGDVRALLAVRQAGALQRGSYAPGALPERLRAERADLAVLPSIGPETYSLALDECWAAGLPTVLFDVGAAAARVRELGGGLLAPLDSAAQGLAAAVAALLREPRPPVVPRDQLPTAAGAARAHLALYEELGIAGS